MRKNGYSKKILMLLTGLTSTCCSAMEKNPEKPKSEISNVVRKRKALTLKNSKSEVSKDARKRSLTPKNSMTLDNILKKRRLGLFTPKQQMEFDKKFGLVDPRRYNGDIIPDVQQLSSIYNEKIEPLFLESFKRAATNLAKKYNKKITEEQVSDLLYKSTNNVRLKTTKEVAIRKADPLSCETSAKLGVWNCRSFTSAWKQFLQDECIPAAAFSMPDHVETLCLVRDSETKKIIPMLLNNTTQFRPFESEIKRRGLLDYPIIALYPCCVEMKNVEFASVPMWVLRNGARLNLKTEKSSSGVRLLAEGEKTAIKNEILNTLKRSSNTPMMNMPYYIIQSEDKYVLVVNELDLSDIKFVKNKELNKDIKVKVYGIFGSTCKDKNITLNSKWEDVKKYFTYWTEGFLPRDITKWSDDPTDVWCLK